MRRGSVAIVPLMLAIALLFWFIAFMGGSDDTLHSVNNVENLQHLEEKLLFPALKYRYDLQEANPGLSEQELDIKVNEYVNEMMLLNKIQ
jgi:hypothetical protein